jgi:hypothetical protein
MCVIESTNMYNNKQKQLSLFRVHAPFGDHAPFQCSMFNDREYDSGIFLGISVDDDLGLRKTKKSVRMKRN